MISQKNNDKDDNGNHINSNEDQVLGVMTQNHNDDNDDNVKHVCVLTQHFNSNGDYNVHNAQKLN